PVAVPFNDTGTPRSNPTTISVDSSGASRGLLVNVYGSSGAAAHGFSSTPHSIARPHMFSSIEYSFSFDAEIGISHLSASSMQSARVSPHTRTGAMTARSGARMRDETSNRTWSLPLPVQP